MDAIKMLWEKIDRESEWTWRYEVFRDNIEKYLPKEEVAECKYYWWPKSECPMCNRKKSEPKKILPLNKLKW